MRREGQGPLLCELLTLFPAGKPEKPSTQLIPSPFLRNTRGREGLPSRGLAAGLLLETARRRTDRDERSRALRRKGSTETRCGKSSSGVGSAHDPPAREAAMEQKSSVIILRKQHSSQGRALAGGTARDLQPEIRDSSPKNLSLSVTVCAGPARLLDQLRGEGTSTRGHRGPCSALGWLVALVSESWTPRSRGLRHPTRTFHISSTWDPNGRNTVTAKN